MTETTIEDMLVAIRNKIKENIKADVELQDIVKIYKGNPNSIPKYPVILLAYDREEITQRHKGRDNIQEKTLLLVTVIEKYLNAEEVEDRLLRLTGYLKKNFITNRYLDGIESESNTWKIIDAKPIEVNYDSLQTKTFVLYSSEIKVEITTEGI